MQKLYYENAYQRSFIAEIIEISQKDDMYHIELDQTYFYPEGGGQPSDSGFIEDSPIRFVYENAGHIYHVTDKKPIKLHKARCLLDWEKRFDYMQQHLGQHILSLCVWDLFHCPTIGFHLGKDYVTIDIDTELEALQIQKAERFANQIISENIPVEVLYPSKSELKKLPLKKPLPHTQEKLRIVKIGDLDLNPCCGIHPHSTIEVQVLKIHKFEKYKNGMRLYFLCGKRAVSDYFEKSLFVQTLSSHLKCSEKDALLKIEKLTQDYHALVVKSKKQDGEIANYEVTALLSHSESVGPIRIVKSLFEQADLKYITLLASKITQTQNVIALLGVRTDQMAHLLFMCSKDFKKVHMGDLLKDTMTLLDGKGGGSPFSAQGGGKDIANLSSALDYAFMKVKQTLMK